MLVDDLRDLHQQDELIATVTRALDPAANPPVEITVEDPRVRTVQLVQTTTTPPGVMELSGKLEVVQPAGRPLPPEPWPAYRPRLEWRRPCRNRYQ